MKNIIIKIASVILILILIILIAGIYKFNFTNSDIFIENENGELVNIDDFGRKTNSNTKLTKERFIIEPNKVDCAGFFQHTCLIVNKELFYDAIEGFNHEEGHRYILDVERNQYCDPDIPDDCPQDTGIYKYKLIREVSKDKI